jgi:hypothetical protein
VLQPKKEEGPLQDLLMQDKELRKINRRPFKNNPDTKLYTGLIFNETALSCSPLQRKDTDFLQVSTMIGFC